MPDIPLEKKFAVLCKIARAEHFAWRDAITEVVPDADIAAIVDRMWVLTAEQTARAYVKRLDTKQPLAPQVAEAFVWSSLCMGEDARAEAADDGSARVCHDDCPWFHFHRERDLLDEDRRGCDAWFSTTVEEINRALDSKLRIETLEALPSGGERCVRRLWVED